MIFYKKILEKENGNDSLTMKNGNKLICQISKKTVGDYLHILFYPLGFFEKKKLEKFVGGKTSGTRDYIGFLSEHNGAVLYSGAIVLFGYTTKVSDDVLQEPASLLEMNKNNPSIDKFIYIGNLMHRDYDDVDLYLSNETGNILMYHKNKLLKQFDNLELFLEHIIDTYDKCYNNKGVNINFGDKSKHVYENIQLY